MHSNAKIGKKRRIKIAEEAKKNSLDRQHQKPKLEINRFSDTPMYTNYKQINRFSYQSIFSRHSTNKTFIYF